jgi:hypothetical protein
LEHGAHVNVECCPLKAAVEWSNTEVVRLLFQHGAVIFQHGADPNHEHLQVHAGLAIQVGNAEILSMLLEHGAVVLSNDDLIGSRTDYSELLQQRDLTRETKLSICRILVEHAKEDSNTAALIQESFKCAIKLAIYDCCEILLQAGMNPSSRWAWECVIQAGNGPAVCRFVRLLVQFGCDPFRDDVDENENNKKQHVPAASSPFHAAARLSDTSILEYLLEIWNERFSSTNGKNGVGDYPLHVVCCDPHVSLQAIMVLVNRQADVLAMVDGEQGLLPCHLAANCGASLDVIFYLLQQCPSALCHHGGNVTSSATNVGPCPPCFAVAIDASGFAGGSTALAQDDDESSSTRIVLTSNRPNDNDSNHKGQDHVVCFVWPSFLCCCNRPKTTTSRRVLE